MRSIGIENKDSGPDFLGAMIVLDDEIVTGDVELHVKSSDWRSHGHHLDPHFNSVVLQVVLWDDAKSPAQLQNSNTIPTLPLYGYLNGSMDDLTVRAEEDQLPALPCRDAGELLGNEMLGEIFDQYGAERFYVKSAFFEVELILEEPEEVLYQGIMGALGYTKNKKAFQKLARLLPFGVLKSISQDQVPENRILTLQALLLGGAGLLPSQCGSKTKMGKPMNVFELERVWKFLEINTAMEYFDWHFFRMHPKNFPTSRLLAAGCLFDRFLNRGLLNGFLDLVGSDNPKNRVTAIENSLTVPDLMGQARAREITVNVVLPFFYSRAQMNLQDELKTHVYQLYNTYPKSGENQITRYLNELLWGNRTPRKAKSAKRQQGMIHLYKTFCQENRCQVCPINGGE